MRGDRLGVRVRKGGSALSHPLGQQLGSRTGCQPWALGCAGQSKMLCSHCSCWELDLSGSSELPVLPDGSTERWVFRGNVPPSTKAQSSRGCHEHSITDTFSLPTLPLSLRAPHPPLLPLCRPHMPGHVEERSSSAHSQRAEGFPGERADQILHIRWPNHCEGEPLLPSPHHDIPPTCPIHFSSPVSCACWAGCKQLWHDGWPVCLPGQHALQLAGTGFSWLSASPDSSPRCPPALQAGWMLL